MDPTDDKPSLFGAVSAKLGEGSGDALDILRLMWTIEHDLNTLSRRMESRQGVAGSHRAVLRYVSLFPGISAGKLSELLQLHPSTLSNVFKRLSAAGLLQRRDDEDDARKRRLHVTDAGKAILQETQGTVDAVIERVVAGSQPDQIRATRELLQKLARELQNELGIGPNAPD